MTNYKMNDRTDTCITNNTFDSSKIYSSSASKSSQEVVLYRLKIKKILNDLELVLSEWNSK